MFLGYSLPPLCDTCLWLLTLRARSMHDAHYANMGTTPSIHPYHLHALRSQRQTKMCHMNLSHPTTTSSSPSGYPCALLYQDSNNFIISANSFQSHHAIAFQTTFCMHFSFLFWIHSRRGQMISHRISYFCFLYV